MEAKPTSVWQCRAARSHFGSSQRSMVSSRPRCHHEASRTEKTGSPKHRLVAGAQGRITAWWLDLPCRLEQMRQDDMQVAAVVSPWRGHASTPSSSSADPQFSAPPLNPSSPCRVQPSTPSSIPPPTPSSRSACPLPVGLVPPAFHQVLPRAVPLGSQFPGQYPVDLESSDDVSVPQSFGQSRGSSRSRIRSSSRGSGRSRIRTPPRGPRAETPRRRDSATAYGYERRRAHPLVYALRLCLRKAIREENFNQRAMETLVPALGLRPGSTSAFIRYAVSVVQPAPFEVVLEKVEEAHCLIALFLGPDLEKLWESLHRSFEECKSLQFPEVYQLRRTSRRVRQISYYDVHWLRAWSWMCGCVPPFDRVATGCSKEWRQQAWICPVIFRFL